MMLQLPEEVEQIIKRIEQAGYEAYAVGGCVRDALLGRIPEDWDITTSASPRQVKALFRRTIDTGIAHGTVTIMMGKEGYEVTTYRVDGDYSDGRHPNSVEFTSSLEEDLKRRDFTINAMAYHPEHGLVDIFHGREDLEHKIIRCVGNAEERFTEDALRVMRAVRFSAQLGFELEEQTKNAIRRLAGNLALVSKERIHTELIKLLISKNPDRIRTAWQLGIIDVILPEFSVMMEQEQNNPYHCYSVGEHCIRVMEHVPPKKYLRLAALLHDVGKPSCRSVDASGMDHFYGHAEVGTKMAGTILRGLKLDNDTIDKVTRLIRYHDYPLTPDQKVIRRCINKVGQDLFEDLLSLKEADVLAKSELEQKENQMTLAQVRIQYQMILEAGNCLSMKTLAVNGKDLIAEGIQPGKQMGEILNQMLEEVLEHPEHNSRDWLLNRFLSNSVKH